MTGPELKALRTKAELTQEKLAEKSGTTRVTIARYETGKRTIPESMEILFKLLMPESDEK